MDRQGIYIYLYDYIYIYCEALAKNIGIYIYIVRVFLYFLRRRYRDFVQRQRLNPICCLDLHLFTQRDPFLLVKSALSQAPKGSELPLSRQSTERETHGDSDGNSADQELLYGPLPCGSAFWKGSDGSEG